MRVLNVSNRKQLFLVDLIYFTAMGNIHGPKIMDRILVNFVRVRSMELVCVFSAMDLSTLVTFSKIA